MPQLYRFGAYLLYFWVNEGMPAEPIHVHVSEKRPSNDGTKIWITAKGGTIVAHNKSEIPSRKLKDIRRFIEANSESIIKRWIEEFGEVDYYC